MVRLKHRYLVLQLLYPSTPPASAATTNSTASPSVSKMAVPLILLHAPTSNSFDARALLTLLRSQLFSLFGDTGAAAVAASLKVMYFSGATSTAIVRCRREGWRLLWAACAFVREIEVVGGRDRTGGSARGSGGGGKGKEVRECVVRIVRVSGTVRKCEEEVVRRARAVIGRLRDGVAAIGKEEDPERGYVDQDDEG